MDVTRRLFVGSAAAAGALVAAGAPAVSPAAQLPLALRITLFDHRFTGAREEALARTGGTTVLPVGSDVTNLLPTLLARCADGCGPVVVAGITTESVPFCLAPALRAAGFTASAPARLSRDLFHWQFSRGVT